MSTTMPLHKFLADDRALSSATVVALLILATLLISIVLAMFILGMGG
jgi:hypothetical protein